MEPGSLETDRSQDTEMVGQLGLLDGEAPSDDPVVEVYSPRSRPVVAGSHCPVAGDRTVGTLEGVRIVDTLEEHPVGVHSHLEVLDEADSQLQQQDVGLAENNQDNSRDSHREVGSLEAGEADTAGPDRAIQKPCAAVGHPGAAAAPETSGAGMADAVTGQARLTLVAEARERWPGVAAEKVPRVCAEETRRGAGRWEDAAAAAVAPVELEPRPAASEPAVALAGSRPESVTAVVRWMEFEAVEQGKRLQKGDLEVQLGVAPGLKSRWFEEQMTREGEKKK